jgi:hypothetical protein
MSAAFGVKRRGGPGEAIAGLTSALAALLALASCTKPPPADDPAPTSVTPNYTVPPAASGARIEIGTPRAPATLTGPAPLIGQALIGSVDAKGISNAIAVVDALRSGFCVCYTEGLDNDPTMSGIVTVRATVGPHNDVAADAVSRGDQIARSVTDCIARRTRHAPFDNPSGRAQKISFDVTLTTDSDAGQAPAPTPLPERPKAKRDAGAAGTIAL